MMTRALTFAAGRSVLLGLATGVAAPLAGQSAPKAVRLLNVSYDPIGTT
jgi:hypothetical protein